MAESKTPREKLAELRKQEAEAALSTPPTVSGSSVSASDVTATVTVTHPEPAGVDAALASAHVNPLVTLHPDDPWTIYCGDIVGGVFQYRDTIVQLDGEYVRAESAVHAQAIRDHLDKLRVDLGLSRSAGTMRRMTTLQEQR